MKDIQNKLTTEQVEEFFKKLENEFRTDGQELRSPSQAMQALNANKSFFEEATNEQVDNANEDEQRAITDEDEKDVKKDETN
jgi:hypothetical protein